MLELQTNQTSSGRESEGGRESQGRGSLSRERHLFRVESRQERNREGQGEVGPSDPSQGQQRRSGVLKSLHKETKGKEGAPLDLNVQQIWI